LGYERIKGELPQINQKLKIDEVFQRASFARNKLINDGYSEVMTYAFRDKGEVEVLASASDKKFLRTNLSDGLKESLKLNQLNAPLLEMNEIKIFEIGTVFKKTGEEMHVAYNEKKEIKEMKLDEFVLSAVDAFSEWSGRGRDPEIRGTEEKISDAVKIFKPWSIYPFISRDIAVWVPVETDSNILKNLIKDNATDLLIREPYIFDSFTKDGKTSYAFRLVFQSNDMTLKAKEVQEIMTNITNKIKDKSDWQIR
jgi:phenylalanyl-tRNA synthetase beta subunit